MNSIYYRVPHPFGILVRKWQKELESILGSCIINTHPPCMFFVNEEPKIKVGSMWRSR